MACWLGPKQDSFVAFFSKLSCCRKELSFWSGGSFGVVVGNEIVTWNKLWNLLNGLRYKRLVFLFILNFF